MSFKDFSHLDYGGHLVRQSRLGNFGKDIMWNISVKLY